MKDIFPPLRVFVILSSLSNCKLKTCVDFFVRKDTFFYCRKIQNIKQYVSDIKWAWILGNSPFSQLEDQTFDAVIIFS